MLLKLPLLGSSSPVQTMVWILEGLELDCCILIMWLLDTEATEARPASVFSMWCDVILCKVMHVGNRDDSSTYCMEGSELTKVNCEKDLGVWISDDMKRSKQCTCAFTPRPLQYWVWSKGQVDIRIPEWWWVCIKHLLGLTLNIVLVLGIQTI